MISPAVPARAGDVPWLRASLVWMIMMIAETMSAFAREVFVAPALGAMRARQAGVIVGSVLVLLIARACAQWLGHHTRRGQLLVGGYWVLLTVTFEVTLGRALGLSWSRILSDYDPAQGGWMLLGLAVMLFAPLLTARKPA